MTRRRAGLLAGACVVLSIGVIGCGRTQPGPPAPAVPPLPDLSRVSPTVQQQLRAQHASLMAHVSEPSTSPTDLAEAYSQMGCLLMAAEYAEPATPFLLNAQTLRPSDMRWPYYLAHAFRLAQNLPMAAEWFERVIHLQPDHVPSLVWLGSTYLTLGQPSRAEPYLMRAIDLQPQSVAAQFWRGRAAVDRHDYQRAIQSFEEALRLNPRADAVHYQLGLAYRGLGDRKAAEAHLVHRADAASMVPDDPLLDALPDLLQNGSTDLARGMKALERRDWLAASDSLRRASLLSPHDAAIQVNLGTALFLAGDASAARQAFEAAIGLSPGLPKAHYTLGLIAEAENRDVEAIGRFSTAIRLEPDYVEAHESLADALRRTGRVEAALSHYRRVLAVDPVASQARFGYAMGLVRLERYRDARDWLVEATRIHPDQAGFAHALARLLAASPDDSVRDGQQALAIMQRLVKAPDNAAADETMAMALAELGRFEEAEEWQRKAVAIARSSGQAPAAVRMAQALERYKQRQPSRIPWSADDPVHTPRPKPVGPS